MSGNTRAIFTKFLCVLFTAVARSFSDGVAISYLLPVLWMSRGEFGVFWKYSNFRLSISLLILLRPPVARYGETAIVWPRATCL